MSVRTTWALLFAAIAIMVAVMVLSPRCRSSAAQLGAADVSNRRKREGLTSIGDTSHRLPGSDCPSCRKPLDAATGINGDVRPAPGDVTVCLYCGHIMVFADDLTVRD